ncbi:MAG: short chain dehydrogenase [Euryarchaeota archaeon]|nr:short chain dehydrogenase [Euryarchaeota archaeon]
MGLSLSRPSTTRNRGVILRVAMAGGTVVVTGAATRIGREISIALSKSGFSVAVHYFSSEDEAEELVSMIQSSGGKASLIRCDLSNSEAVPDIISKAESALGPVVGLVNNASLFSHDDISNVSGISWNEHMEVNALSPVLLISELTRRIPDGETGSIVNILDQKIAQPNPDHLSYTASRFAMLGITEALARGLAPQVRVNAIAPGHTLKSREQTQSGFDRAQSETPLGFGPSPIDIAETVVFLMQARSITGQTIFVDSGERFLARERDVYFETEG